MSDNGPQFQREYNEFCEEWNIAHTTSSPRYAKSYGFIERQIRYIKPIIKKCIASSGDVYLALLNVRATPLDSTLPSPAGLMFGRKISTTVPNYQHLAVNDDIRDHFSKLSDQQKSHHDNVSKELAPLMTNQSVRIYYPAKNQWYIGKICPEREIDHIKLCQAMVQFSLETAFICAPLCHQTIHHKTIHPNMDPHMIIKAHPIRLIQNHTHNLVCSQHQIIHNIVHVMVVLLDHQYDIPLSNCVNRYTRQARIMLYS